MNMGTTVYGEYFVKVDPEGDVIRLMFDEGDDETYLCTADEQCLKRLITNLQIAQNQLATRKERLKKIMETTNFTDIYSKMDEKYNPYPVQMSRASAFRYALRDGLIDQDTYIAARRYYGKLWDYVGD